MTGIPTEFGLLDMTAVFALALAPTALIVCMAARAAFGRGGSARMAGLSVAIGVVLVLEYGLSLGAPSPWGFGYAVRGGLAVVAMACWAVSAVLPGYWRRVLDVAILCSLALGGIAWLALS